MKYYLTLFATILIPLQFISAGIKQPLFSDPSFNIPDQFLTSPNTKSSEWGCPVNDHIKAQSKAAAIQEIEIVCQKEILKAAQNTPETRNIISIKTIWPDLQIYEAEGGYKLTGTIFFETLSTRR